MKHLRPSRARREHAVRRRVTTVLDDDGATDLHGVSSAVITSAYNRAYHHAHDPSRIFDDYLAHHLLTEDEVAHIERSFLVRMARMHPGIIYSNRDAALRAAVHAGPEVGSLLARARYNEDELVAAIHDGVRQYVSLGAGLDTFGYRRVDLRNELQVFELDRPANLRSKVARLERAGIQRPANVHHAEIDLEAETVASVLLDLPAFDWTAPTWFSWLGAIPYLSRDLVAPTLASIRDVASTGSHLVLSYLQCKEHAEATRSLYETAQEAGAPVLSTFDPREIEALLATHGFRVVRDLGRREQHERYFEGRQDELAPGTLGRIVHARAD